MRAVLIALAVGISPAAEAATFYYVSGPYSRSDYDVAVTPIMTTGVLEIDESKLAGGLAGAEVSMEVNSDALVRVTFQNGARSHTLPPGNSSIETWRFRFDDSGMIRSTAFCQFCTPDDDSGWYIFDNDPWSPFIDPVDANIVYNPVRNAGHFEPFGQWFADPLAWAAEIQRNAAHSAINPPSNRFHDGPAPVPLPAAAWLLICGLGLLGGLKLRARGAGC